MNGKHYVGKRVSSFQRYDDIGPVAGIALVVDDEHEYLSGDQNGYVLEVPCSYGTQAMANQLLAAAKGKVYKGYSATNAPIPALAELGDAVTVNGLYGLLASREVDFGGGHCSDIAAPGENTVEHRYPVGMNQSARQKRYTDRKIADTRSIITKTAEEIRLEVQQNYATKTALGETETRLNSSITQTATSITSEVSKTYATKTELGTAQETLSSKIEQTVESIKLSVTNSDSSSTLTLKAGETTLSSASITFTGLVNFVAKEDIYTKGKATIDGGKITAKSISVDKLNVDDLSAIAAKIGGWSISSTGITYDSRYNGVDYRVTLRGISDTTSGTGVFYVTDRTNNKYPFRVDVDGSFEATKATIEGKVTATSGKIGNWNIGTALYSGTNSMTSTTAGTYLGTDGIRNYASGSKYVNITGGVLTANGANITGAITTSEGHIGGWEIVSGGITYDSSDGLAQVKLRHTNNTSKGNSVFHIATRAKNTGNDTWDEYPFRVNGDGSFVATKATITGKITATSGSFTGDITAKSGTVGGWKISATELSNKTDNGYGVYIVPRTSSELTKGVFYIAAPDGTYPFVVYGNGRCTATAFEISGSSTFSGGLVGATGTLSGVTGSYAGSINSDGTFKGSYGSLSYNDGSTSGTYYGGLSNAWGSYNGNVYGGTGNGGGVLSSCSLGGTTLTTGGGGSFYSQSSQAYVQGNSVQLKSSGSGNLTVTGSGASVVGGFSATGDISCSGDKERVIKTPHFGTRSLHAYETPLPTFSDYGTATLDETGMFYIVVDSIFAETVNGAYLPTVFLTKYGEGDIWVERVTHDIVTVHGTPGLGFAWETRYVQANAGVERLRVMDFDYRDVSTEHDFEVDAAIAYEHSRGNIDYARLGYEYFTEFERSIEAA